MFGEGSLAMDGDALRSTAEELILSTVQQQQQRQHTPLMPSSELLQCEQSAKFTPRAESLRGSIASDGRSAPVNAKGAKMAQSPPRISCSTPRASSHETLVPRAHGIRSRQWLGALEEDGGSESVSGPDDGPLDLDLGGDVNDPPPMATDEVAKEWSPDSQSEGPSDDETLDLDADKYYDLMSFVERTLLDELGKSDGEREAKERAEIEQAEWEAGVQQADADACADALRADEAAAFAAKEADSTAGLEDDEGVLLCPVCRVSYLAQSGRDIFCLQQAGPCPLRLVAASDGVNLTTLRVQLAAVHHQHHSSGCRAAPTFVMSSPVPSMPPMLQMKCEACGALEFIG